MGRVEYNVFKTSTLSLASISTCSYIDRGYSKHSFFPDIQRYDNTRVGVMKGTRKVAYHHQVLSLHGVQYIPEYFMYTRE